MRLEDVNAESKNASSHSGAKSLLERLLVDVNCGSLLINHLTIEIFG